jgi:tRNA G18 (ribose-2'-O)-methylase SpoU
MDAPDLDLRMIRKAEAVLQWRTCRLLLVIERCTNDHNYSAILRSAEALGIQHVFMIDPPPVEDVDADEGEVLAASQRRPQQQQQQHQQQQRTPEEIEQRRLHHLFARNATEWLTVRDFETSEECVAEIRRLGYLLWVTDLSQEAEPLERVGEEEKILLPDKIALVMGTEAVGASQYMLEQADRRVYLPLRGFADSLNLSVATALILHHLFLLDPTLIGAMSETERSNLRRAWYVKLAQQRLLSASQKKARTRLQGKIKKCERLFEKAQQDPTYKLQPGEEKRLDEWPQIQQELDAIDAILDPVNVEASIQEWLENPPQALSDLRRADSHRVCFVGKNTKEIHKQHWKDMVATSNAGSIHGATATAFREKVHKTSVPENPKQSSNEESSEAKTKSDNSRSTRFIEKHF